MGKQEGGNKRGIKWLSDDYDDADLLQTLSLSVAVTLFFENAREQSRHSIVEGLSSLFKQFSPQPHCETHSPYRGAFNAELKGRKMRLPS